MLPASAGEAARLLGESGGPPRVIWLSADGKAWLTEPEGQLCIDLWAELEFGHVRGFVSWDDGGSIIRGPRRVPVVCLAGGRLPLELAASAVWWSEPGHWVRGLTPIPPASYPELDPGQSAWTAVEGGLWLEALAERDLGGLSRLLHQLAIVRRERRQVLTEEDVSWERALERSAAAAGRRVRVWLSRHARSCELGADDASGLLDRLLSRLQVMGRESRGMEGTRFRHIGLALGMVLERFGVDISRFETPDDALESDLRFDGGSGDDAGLREAAARHGLGSLLANEREFAVGESERRQRLLSGVVGGKGMPLAIEFGPSQLVGGVWNGPQQVSISGACLFEPPLALKFPGLFLSAGVPVAWDRTRELVQATVNATASRLEGDGVGIPDKAAGFGTLSIDSRQLVVRGGSGTVRADDGVVVVRLEGGVQEGPGDALA